MLRYWQSHQEYCFFLHEAKVHFDSSQRCRLFSTFASSREKLRLLNLDPVMEFLTPYTFLFFYWSSGSKPGSDPTFLSPYARSRGYQCD